MKKIAILGANEPLESFIKQTKDIGYEVHMFAWEEGAVCKKYADHFYAISFADQIKVLEKCKRIEIDGIVSFSLETALPTVNFVAQEMGLEGNPIECEMLTKSKYTMREQLRNRGINIPQYVCISSANELTNYNFKFPQIVKPVDSGGSRGVTKVDHQSELEPAFQRALHYSKKGQVLVEEFIDGREFSIEYISFHGEHYFIAVTDKVTTGPPYFVELEHHQPADIDTQVKNRIKDLTARTLDALKIYSSASHTEVKMDDNGDLFIIEIGARMGGDMITSDLVRLSTGYDFVRGVLELATGDFTVPKFTQIKCSGIYFLAQETQYVLNFIEKYRNYPEIVKQKLNSKDLKSVQESNDRSGYFIYQSDHKFLLKN